MAYFVRCSDSQFAARGLRLPGKALSLPRSLSPPRKPTRSLASFLKIAAHSALAEELSTCGQFRPDEDNRASLSLKPLQ